MEATITIGAQELTEAQSMTVRGAIESFAQQLHDSDQYPQGPYRAGGGYADRPQHCENCGTFLQNPLTDDGLVYIREVITAEDMESPIVRTWMDFYKKDLDAQANKGAR